MTPTFRYHPSVVAQAFATLGVMFPSRVVLGLGSGAVAQRRAGDRHQMGGLQGAAGPPGVKRSDLMRRLWTEERVTFEGQYYKTEKATIYDRPEQPVPIYVAASGPTVAKMAGEIAEGYICTSGKAPDLYTQTLLPNVAAGLQAAGRASDSIDRMIEMKVSFDTDRQRALDDTRNWAALALSPEEKVSVEDAVEIERLADALPVERTAKRWIVSTDPDEHVARIKVYADLGFRHLVFHAPGTDQKRSPASLWRAGPAATARCFRR